MKEFFCLFLKGHIAEAHLSLNSSLRESYVNTLIHTGKCIRRFGGIYAYCRYIIDRKW